MTEDLREAHEMFQKKFESLQSELMRSRYECLVYQSKRVEQTELQLNYFFLK